ncbi:unnamed protein product [Toxocara canis]|uniref:WD_REPEATS_REGION domain-containing protein n=1 Tax=Toxocara canis TaxID=6265 RepID=A0A183V4N0_TOXCA|nr:unnamed protein product [Toxocara canis]
MLELWSVVVDGSVVIRDGCNELDDDRRRTAIITRTAMTQNPPSSGLHVPVVLWGKKPPRNRVSCIRPLPDGKTFVTGSFDGELIVWEMNEDTLSARIMIVGHESHVTAVSPTGVSATSTRFVSASSDGQLSVWESGDGRSVDTVLSTYVHRQITPFCTRSGAHNLCRLYCVGEYAEVIVLDPQDLNILFTLSSRVEPDWIVSIAFFKTNKNVDALNSESEGISATDTWEQGVFSTVICKEGKDLRGASDRVADVP